MKSINIQTSEYKNNNLSDCKTNELTTNLNQSTCKTTDVKMNQINPHANEPIASECEM